MGTAAAASLPVSPLGQNLKPAAVVLFTFLCSVCGGKSRRRNHILTCERSAASCQAEPVFLHPTQLPKQNCQKGQIPESTPNAALLQMIPLSWSSAHQLCLFLGACPDKLFPQLAAVGKGSLLCCEMGLFAVLFENVINRQTNV